MPLINRFWFATLAPALFGFGAILFCTWILRDYGYALFLALPIIVPFLTAFFYSWRQPERTYGKTYGVAMAGLGFLALMLMIMAVEGAICILMAAPLAAVVALIGTSFGRLVAQLCAHSWKAAGTPPLVLILGFPGLATAEKHFTDPAPMRAVTTRVVVNAPIQRVWDTVIAFPHIDAKPGALFRAGIAYPIQARIEGTGVGAIRYCMFSTGDFVEPVTTWDAPNLLAFDVTAYPEPMQEMTFYDHLDAPHLHGFMVSHHGQFRLKQEGDQVVLEGTTWYTHEIYPQWYWGPIADEIIHQIHGRVLDHIKATAESSPAPSGR